MVDLKTEVFNYDLPRSFIAQKPASPRDSSNLLAYDTSTDTVQHLKFHQIDKLLSAGDRLVVNSSKVIPARVLFYIGQREHEVFILKQLSGSNYKAMVRPGKFFSLGKKFNIKGIEAKVLKIFDDGTREINFSADILKMGSVPLPPYISGENIRFSQYQTIYSKQKGSVAAPTAGLHFTKRLISKLLNRGISFDEVVLHVGRGTFLPVKADFVRDHTMHSELYSLDRQGANNLNKAISNGSRIIAVGTTSVRSLESNYINSFTPACEETDIFIYPGRYKWKVVDALITNFHLPRSTLLMLVASFLESKNVKNPIQKLFELYELAKNRSYRFYSFGDSMFIY